MKLLIILLLVAGTANAQRRDTLNVTTPNLLIVGDSLYYWASPSYGRTIGAPDTSRALLLCADTAKVKWSIRQGNAASFKLSDGSTLNVLGVRNGYAPMCFWLEGYQITEGNKPTRYLNYNRKPLSKEVFVWMSVRY